MKDLDFSLLGLNKYETLAYEALTRLGKSGAYDIARESGVPFGRIYDILDSLITKGLVSAVPEATKKFVAQSPHILEHLLDQQMKKFQDMKDQLAHIKETYITTEEPIEVVQGKRNFYKIVAKLPKAKKYSYIIKTNAEIRPEWVKEMRARIKRGAKVKALVRVNEETKSNVQRWKKLVPRMEHRAFENENIAASIIDDETVMFALIKSNVTFLVRDRDFARLMKRCYELLWKKAESI